MKPVVTEKNFFIAGVGLLSVLILDGILQYQSPVGNFIIATVVSMIITLMAIELFGDGYED